MVLKGKQLYGPFSYGAYKVLISYFITRSKIIDKRGKMTLDWKTKRRIEKELLAELEPYRIKTYKPKPFKPKKKITSPWGLGSAGGGIHKKSRIRGTVGSNIT